MENRTGRGIVILVLGLIACLTFPGAALAAGFSQATVEYSADRHMSTDGGAMTGKVYSAPGKERNELNDGQQVSIMRMDKKLMWMLMPSEKMYMEHKFGEGKAKRTQGNYQECDIRQTDAGDETVNGFRAKKKVMEISCPDREKYSGTIWLTKENIAIKMETAAKTGGSKKDVFRMELKNLKIGKQDPKLFEIPAGYEKMEIPSMENIDIRKMMKEQSRPAPPPKETVQPAETGRAYTATGRSYSAQPREKSAVDQVLDPAKKLKNLLGW